MTWLLLAAALGLAFSNGANDNLTGVATIYGSGGASFRTALAWGTAAAFAGSRVSAALAAGLIDTFSGTGLVPARLAGSPAVQAVGSRLGVPLLALAMAAGGLLGARRVAETMSHRIPRQLTPGKASLRMWWRRAWSWLLPATACPPRRRTLTNGRLFGIGAVTRRVRWRTVATIAAAWVTTLPLGAALGALAYLAL